MTATVEEEYDLDVDVLISLIEERPVLWDKTLESYKSKTETTAAWREICARLNPVFEDLPDKEKNIYGKNLIKKWTNIRDRYTKYLKKLEEQSTTGSKAKTVKKYIYSDQMSFLKSNSVQNKTLSSLDDSQEEENDFEESTDRQRQSSIENASTENASTENASTEEVDRTRPPPTKKRSHPKYTEVEKTIMNKLKEPDDRHMSFFKGILPSLQLLKDDEVIMFQSGVLNVLQDIHKARQNIPVNPYPGYNFPNQPNFQYQIYNNQVPNFPPLQPNFPPPTPQLPQANFQPQPPQLPQANFQPQPPQHSQQPPQPPQHSQQPPQPPQHSQQPPQPPQPFSNPRAGTSAPFTHSHSQLNRSEDTCPTPIISPDNSSATSDLSDISFTNVVTKFSR